MTTTMFQNCPVCDKPETARPSDNWQAQAEAGVAIPIVGCGNPWHYDGVYVRPTTCDCPMCQHHVTAKVLAATRERTGQ